MTKIKLEIAGLTYSQTQSGAYALMLSEADGTRQLPIIIGGFEAQAIAIELENMTPTRPLTHDLFKTLSLNYQIKVTEVLIYKLNEGVFYAKIICEREGEIKEIDARTSDAIAIGVRFKCPIYTYESILDSAGISNDEDIKEITDDDFEDDAPKDELSQLSENELNEKLMQAIENEEYELASKIRDEINKRNK